MAGMVTSERDEKKVAHARHPGTPAASPMLSREPAAASGLPRFLQAKLAASQPDHVHEREANHVAEQVLKMPAKKVQRACASCAAGAGRCPTCSARDERAGGRLTSVIDCGDASRANRSAMRGW